MYHYDVLWNLVKHSNHNRIALTNTILSYICFYLFVASDHKLELSNV